MTDPRLDSVGLWILVMLLLALLIGLEVTVFGR